MNLQTLKLIGFTMIGFALGGFFTLLVYEPEPTVLTTQTETVQFIFDKVYDHTMLINSQPGNYSSSLDEVSSRSIQLGQLQLGKWVLLELQELKDKK